MLTTETSGGNPENVESAFRSARISEFKYTPVDMETFVYDKYFLGNTCKDVHPQLVTALSELFKGGYDECNLMGCSGSGRTTAASIGVCRILYELSCLRDPHASFGFAKESSISILVMAITERNAVETLLEDIATKVSGSPYFRENFPFERGKRNLGFRDNIFVAAKAFADTSALGFNAIAAVVDDASFASRKSKSSADMTESRTAFVWSSLKKRMKSRFQKLGRLPGMMFVISECADNAVVTRRIDDTKLELEIR
jgi:hypothetical protein